MHEKIAASTKFVKQHKTAIIVGASFTAGVIVATVIAKKKYALPMETAELLATYLEVTNQRADYATWLFGKK